MSTTTQDVLLSDERLREIRNTEEIVNMMEAMREVRSIYEADRTKLLDLIRQGVEAVEIQAKSLRTYGPHPLIELQEQAFLSKVKEQLPNL